jgi:hypothetical protein
MKVWIAALVFVLLTSTAWAQPSADNSRVPPLASVQDSAGAVWTMQAGTGKGRILYRNGAQACDGRGAQIVIWKGVAYAEGDDTVTNWYQWINACWTSIGSVAPFPAVVVPPAPPVLVTGSSRIGWIQPNQTVAQATAGVSTLYTDTVGKALTGVVCVVTGADTACSAPLPALTPGAHALALTYRVNAAGVESAKSNIINVTTTTSLTPTGLSLKP